MLPSKKRRSWKGTILALTLAVGLTAAVGCGNKEESNATVDNSAVVATYEGGQITQAQFDKELANMLLFYPDYEMLLQEDSFREYFVKQQIAYEYLTANASEESKAVGKERAEQQLSDMKAQVGEDTLKEMLDAQQLTEQDLLDYMTRILTVVDHYNSQVTDEEVKAQFEANKEDMTVASVRHILVSFTDSEGNERTEEEALKRANEIKSRLDKGEDMAELAKEFSDDGNASTGGLYEDVEVGNWVTEFKEAALTLPLNEISEPVKTSYGYHVMRVEKRTEKTFDTLTDEEKETLKTIAASEKMNKFMEEELEGIITSITLPSVAEEQPAEDQTSTENTDETTESGSTDATDEPADNAGTETESGDNK